MRIEVLAVDLASVIDGSAPPTGRWTDAEVRHVRLVAQCARAARTPKDLFALRVLRLRHTDEPEIARVELNTQHALLITFKGEDPITAVFDIASPGMEAAQ